MDSQRIKKIVEEEIRCQCHRLIAKSIDNKLELVCPRCKRKVVINVLAMQKGGAIKQNLTFI
ncbi:hypothetical protein K8T06_16205 [bacterium]|nr:hypothetical protein [bacterium]